MNCTYQNFIEITLPISLRLIEIYNQDRLDNDRKLLTKIEEDRIKSTTVSNFLYLAYRYMKPEDILVGHSFNLGYDGNAEGYVRFQNENGEYFINTECIFVHGEIQCPHYRYILRNTNAPKLNGDTRKESVKKLDKLFIYVNDVESTNEFRDIKRIKNRIETIKNSIKETEEISNYDLFLLNSTHLAKHDQYKDHKFINIEHYNFKNAFLSIGYSQEDVDKMFEEFTNKFNETVGTPKYSLEFYPYMTKLGQELFDKSYDEKMIKKMEKTRLSIIKSKNKEIEKELKNIDKLQNKINMKVDEFKNIINQ